MRSIHFFAFTLLLAALPIAYANGAGTQAQIDAILAGEEPFGVVFEIVQGDEDALHWAIPEVNRYVTQLRERFPDIALAVVSHGAEQFALTKDGQADNAEVHQGVKSLVGSDVPVHVCGTHATWRDKSAADFPDYVDVAPAGPTEIRNYQAMGYHLVLIRRP